MIFSNKQTTKWNIFITEGDNFPTDFEICPALVHNLVVIAEAIN